MADARDPSAAALAALCTHPPPIQPLSAPSAVTMACAPTYEELGLVTLTTVIQACGCRWWLSSRDNSNRFEDFNRGLRQRRASTRDGRTRSMLARLFAGANRSNSGRTACMLRAKGW